MSSRYSLSRVLRSSSAFFLLSVAIGAAGCAPLPYFLTQKRETILGVEIAVETDAIGGNNHVTLVRGFIRSSEVHELSAVVGNVMATTRLEDAKVLGRLEQRMVEAFKPFGLNPETATAFIVTPDGAPMSDATITTVERFIPDATSLGYRPQAVVGTAKPCGATVSQLGHAGTGERVLWTWTGEAGAKRP